MSVIVLRYSLYNLKNLEQGPYGPLCMASGRQRFTRIAVSAVSEAASCARLTNALPAAQRHARWFQMALSGLRRPCPIQEFTILVGTTSLLCHTGRQHQRGSYLPPPRRAMSTRYVPRWRKELPLKGRSDCAEAQAEERLPM
jgi:hypothetical protein